MPGLLLVSVLGFGIRTCYRKFFNNLNQQAIILRKSNIPIVFA